jgi:hypothetical protein
MVGERHGMCELALKFPTVTTSGDNTVVVENDVTSRKLMVYLGFTNRICGCIAKDILYRAW